MRRRSAEKRKILPDPRYKNVTLSKFINCVMIEGKKSIAESIVYNAIDRLGGSDDEKIEKFITVLENVRPMLEVRSRRVGGATYQVPIEVNQHRGQALAIRWIIAAAKGRSGHTMIEKLYNEFKDALENKGAAVKKKIDTHKMAEANRAFAHYRF